MGQKKDPLLEARISAGTENGRAQRRIAEALFGMNKVDINELKIQLMDKLGEKLGHQPRRRHVVLCLWPCHRRCAEIG